MDSTTQQAQHATEIPAPRSARRLLAALLAAFVRGGGDLVACGDDDEQSSGGGREHRAGRGGNEPLSKNEYLTQVNEAQGKFAAESKKLDLAEPKGPKDFQNKLEGLIPWWTTSSPSWTTSNRPSR